MSIITLNDTKYLNTRSSLPFFVAGGLFVLFAGLWGVYAFTAMDSEVIQNIVGPAGWAAAFVGLFSIYTRLAAENPMLSHTAALLAAFGFAGAISTALGNFFVLLDVIGIIPRAFEILQLSMGVGIVPGFIMYALTALRTEYFSHRVALLLMIPAGLFVVNTVRVATLGPTTPIWSPSILGAAQALALIAIGYALHTETNPPVYASTVEN